MIIRIDFVSMPMSLYTAITTIDLCNYTTFLQYCLIRSQPHRSTFVANMFLVWHNVNDRVGSIWINLCTMCIPYVADISCILYDSQLHSITDAQKRYQMSPSILDSIDHTLCSPCTKTSRHHKCSDMMLIYQLC